MIDGRSKRQHIPLHCFLKGGLPKSPSDELSSIQPLVELAELVPSNSNQISTEGEALRTADSPPEQKQEVVREPSKSIVEANTIARDSHGRLRLIADSTPHSPAIPQLVCQ